MVASTRSTVQNSGRVASKAGERSPSVTSRFPRVTSKEPPPKLCSQDASSCAPAEILSRKVQLLSEQAPLIGSRFNAIRDPQEVLSLIDIYTHSAAAFPKISHHLRFKLSHEDSAVSQPIFSNKPKLTHDKLRAPRE